MEWSLKVILVAQCTCKEIENFARAPRDEKSRNNFGSRQPVQCSLAQWDASNGIKLFIFGEKSSTRQSWSLATQLIVKFKFNSDMSLSVSSRIVACITTYELMVQNSGRPGFMWQYKIKFESTRNIAHILQTKVEGRSGQLQCLELGPSRELMT